MQYIIHSTLKAESEKPSLRTVNKFVLVVFL